MQPTPPSKPGIPFNPTLFFVGLVLTAVLGLVSVLRHPYGYPSFAARVSDGLSRHDVWIILAAVLTLVLVLWLLLALLTGRFKTRK